MRRCAGAEGVGPRRIMSRKLLRILDRLGCFNFRSALASICLMRSRSPKTAADRL